MEVQDKARIMDLKGKAVPVTGGSRGEGLGLVEVLVERGADVTVLARDRTVLTALQTRLGVHIVAADVADAASGMCVSKSCFANAFTSAGCVQITIIRAIPALLS